MLFWCSVSITGSEQTVEAADVATPRTEGAGEFFFKHADCFDST